MPLVSVIIPTYNRGAVLPRAIDSVLAQSATPPQNVGRMRPSAQKRWTDPSFGGKGSEFELIIVDDGSTDEGDGLIFEKGTGTPALAFARKRRGASPLCARGRIRPTHCGGKSACPPFDIRFFRHEKNSGPSAARNLGIKHAKGEWIAFLDSDDEWLPGKLKAQLKFFEENPDYLICQTEEIWVRNGKRVNPMKKHKKYGGFIFEKCLPLCVVSPSAVMMRRKLFDEVGLFDESLPACEDYDLWLRIASRFPVGLIEKPYIVKYGGHADQRSREFPAMDRFRIRSLAKILASGTLTPEQASAARKTLEEKAKIYIEGALKRGKEKATEEVQQFIAGLLAK